MSSNGTSSNQTVRDRLLAIPPFFTSLIVMAVGTYTVSALTGVWAINGFKASLGMSIVAVFAFMATYATLMLALEVEND